MNDFELFTKLIMNMKGRDKLSKLISYLGKLFAFILLQQQLKLGTKEYKTQIKQLSSLASGTSLARKCDRLFRSFVEINKIMKTLNDDDNLLKYLSIFQAFFYSFYWYYDNRVFLCKIKFTPNTDVKLMANKSYKFWFAGAILVVIINIIKLNALYNKRKNDENNKSIDSKINTGRLSLIGSICDVIVAGNQSGFVESIKGAKLNDGTIGICGVLSAYITLYNLWISMKYK
mmetsp:Transcript_11352/g.14227  ORF Transcript_11352/g.14227 Transcript_11352/m.14227 type:complete len:231 (-) Transcript_11352:72-764(-)